MAAVQKRLVVVLAVDGHAQKLSVKLLGACHVLHMQDEMVDAVGLDHVAFLLYSGVHPRLSGWKDGYATPQRHGESWLHGTSLAQSAATRDSDLLKGTAQERQPLGDLEEIGCWQTGEHFCHPGRGR